MRCYICTKRSVCVSVYERAYVRVRVRNGGNRATTTRARCLKPCSTRLSSTSSHWRRCCACLFARATNWNNRPLYAKYSTTFKLPLITCHYRRCAVQQQQQQQRLTDILYQTITALICDLCEKAILNFIALTHANVGVGVVCVGRTAEMCDIRDVAQRPNDATPPLLID